MVERLWAGWRIPSAEAAAAEAAVAEAAAAEAAAAEAAVAEAAVAEAAVAEAAVAEAAAADAAAAVAADATVADGLEVPEGTTLFEAILHSGLPDEETCIVWRGELCFALLNIYPYARGHLLVVPYRPVTALGDLTSDEHDELWAAVCSATLAVTAAYEPHGINVGANLGRGSGAGVPDHLHVHVVPRFAGDTNFMTSVANVRVMPETLSDTWHQLVASWPAV